jgi:cysteine desulfurase/selenocysteine lyase
MQRIYLDNAATSWPKPPEVYVAVDRYFRELGAPAGRSAYAEAAEVEGAITRARAAIARLIGAESPRQVAFAFNGTDALNMAIHGILRPGGHVIATDAEHNSVLRPLHMHAERHGVEVTFVPCDGRGIINPADVRAAIRPDTQLIVLTHASNVTGALQPAAEVGAIAREHGIPLLLDAAQTLGDVPIDAEALHVDLLAAPGHKGLLGPLGTGILYVRPGLEERVQPLRQGGTGTRSEEEFQPSAMPQRYESGNHNVPGLVGLEASLAWLAERGVEWVRQHQHNLVTTLLAGLRENSNVTLYGPESAEQRVGVVSLNVAGYDPQELAGGLDAAYRIQTRAGLHCAPRMHRSLGTLATGGTLRVSVGPFNTAEHIEAFLAALREL